MNQADEIVGHNSDNFDIRWVRTRCLLHNISAFPEYNSIDTYKLAKKYFRFNSNKLDYISSLLGFGHKLHTGFDLWKDICLDNSKTAMNKMVTYCKKDVLLLEKVHNQFKNYTKHKTHVGVSQGDHKIDCPECGSDKMTKRGVRVSAAGTKSQELQCQDCGKYHRVLITSYTKEINRRTNKARI